MEELKAFLLSLQDEFPITLDRYTERDGFYHVFGWIDNPKGRDFILLNLKIEDILMINFYTSSAKYSKLLTEFIYGTDKHHTDCKKIEELLK